MSKELFEKSKFKDPIEPKLKYQDGKLHMIDGSGVKKYLRSWARVCGIPEGEEMVVMTAKQYEAMRKDLLFWKAAGGIG